jgi:hypothetical protein
MSGRSVQGTTGWIDRAVTVITVIFAILAGSLALGIALAPQGLSNPGVPFWGVFALGLLAAGYGRRRGARWAAVLTGIFGAAIILIFLFVAIFSVALGGGDLSRPMLGLPVVGPVNGWLSFGVFGVVIVAGVLMVASAILPSGQDLTG